MFESVLLLAPKHFNASSVPAKCSKDRGGTARARERGNVPEIARVLKNEHSHCLLQHLWMCFIQSCQVRCCVFSMLGFQRLSALWDIDLVLRLKIPELLPVPVGPGRLMASPCTSQASYNMKFGL